MNIKIKRLICFIFFIICFIAVNNLLKYLLTYDTSSYTRITIHEFYNQEQNIDVLFLGSSHCYRSLDTSITDEIFNTNTFNAGTSDQRLDGSYALLVEADKYYDLKEVYLELYYSSASLEKYKDRDSMTNTYIISDYMKPSFNKYSYLINASSPQHYIHSFIPGRRNYKRLFDFKYISELLTQKMSSQYRNFLYIKNDTEAYRGKGFVASDVAVNQGSFYSSNNFDSMEYRMGEDYKNSLKQIIDYCNNHNIKLTLYSAPMPDFRLCDIGNYDYWIEQVNEFIADTGINYYDFNLCKEDYLKLNDEDFMDTDHLNLSGAKKFSIFFSEFFNYPDYENDIFYKSYEEKLNTIEKRVFGIITQMSTDNQNNLYQISYVSNIKEDIQMEYHITKIKENQDSKIVITDWDTNNKFSIPIDEHGTINILARFAEKNDIISNVSINY